MSVTVRTRYNDDILKVHNNNINIGGLIDQLKARLQETLDTSVTLNIYNLGGVAHPFDARLDQSHLFLHASPIGDQIVLEENPTFEGIGITGNVFQHTDIENSIVFYADNQVPIGVYIKPKRQFYIYFDVLSQTQEVANKFTSIICTALLALNDRYSWMRTEDRKALVQTIREHNQSDTHDRIRHLKDEIDRAERNARDYRVELTRALARADQRKKELVLIESGSGGGIKHITDQLDMLKTVPLVTDVHIKQDYIHIYTDDLYINHDKNEKRYHAGKYEIRIRMNDSDIKFYNVSGNLRRSYWGPKCHHPHVSESGSPCLGNVATTLAELCSTKDIYSLVIVAINYLESVNTDDPAGKHIKNWDEVDEDNNIIKKGNPNGRPNEVCNRCEESVEDPDDMIEVYTEVDSDGDIYDSVRMCRSCAQSRDVFYSSHYETYLLGSLAEDDDIADTEDDREYL